MKTTKKPRDKLQLSIILPIGLVILTLWSLYRNYFSYYDDTEISMTTSSITKSVPRMRKVQYFDFFWQFFYRKISAQMMYLLYFVSRLTSCILLLSLSLF